MKTRGAHGAYVHLTGSASRIAAQIVTELATLEAIEAPISPELTPLTEAARVEIDRTLGDGAADIIGRVTVNVGRMEAGLKVNMIPSECRLEIDIRLPLGVERDLVMARGRGDRRTPSRGDGRGDQPHRRLLVRSAAAPWSGSCRTTSSS